MYGRASSAPKSHQSIWVAVILATIGLFVALAALSYLQSVRADKARESSDRIGLAVQHALRLENAVTRMESRHRGFLLTGSERLQRLRDRDFQIGNHEIGALRTLMDEEPGQVSRLAEIARLFERRHARMLATSSTAATSGLVAARSQFDYRSEEAFDPIINRLSEFREVEQGLLADVSALASERTDGFGHTLAGATAVVFAILLMGAFSLLRQLRRREQLRRSLEHANTFNRLIMDQSPDVICVIDREGRFVEVSAASHKVFGYGPAEMKGVPFMTLVHPDDRAATEEAAAVIMGGQPMVGFSNRYMAKDGSVVDIDWSATWSEDDGLNFCVARDGAERKRAERSERLNQAELAAKAAELQHTNRELEAFSYTISHDLRAPLRHISGYAQMLREDAAELLSAEMLRYMDAISQAARQMGVLIDDLLAFSKLGRRPIERTATDMDLVVAAALHDLGLSTSDPRISVGSLPPAHADPALIKQVWINLLSNAIKYSQPRGDDARIQVTGQLDGQRLRYVVQDNGVGFDMRYADKLFAVFQRLHVQEEFEGTGVGLAIVERILVRHGGSITADSAPGQGATFTFDLPSHPVAAPRAAEEVAA